MPNSRQDKAQTIDVSNMPRLLRGALAHMYDVAHLQTHPLVQALELDTSGGAVSQGQALRRLLLDTLEKMRPGDQVPYGDKAWRPYRVLSYRYAQRMSVLETQSEMGISERQLQREHAQALRIMASLIGPHLVHPNTSEQPGAPADPFDAAIERFMSGSRPEQLALGELVESVVADLAAMADQRGVALQIVQAPYLESLYGDRGVLRQIILSVLAHALNETARTGLTITLETNTRHAQVSLALDASASRDALKAGDQTLPERLALAQRMAHALSGGLTLEDGVVTLTLPLSRQIILVVDDNRDMVDLLERFLADGRYKVMGALSGQEALAMAPRLEPYLILLDVMMPSQDGWEVLQHLKHNPKTSHIPVAVCSILPEQQLALSLGADDYLAKPVTQQALLALLRRLEHQPLE